MTTSWSRSLLRPSGYSGDNVKTLHKLSQCGRQRCWSFMIHLWLNDFRNRQIECALLPISFTEVVSCIPPYGLSQFIELHLLRPTAPHALVCRFDDYANHPAGFVMIAHLTQLSLFMILIFPILQIFGTCEIT